MMMFSYSLFFIAVSTGAKNGSGQLKDILAGNGEADILFIRFIAGIFFLGLSTIVLFEKRTLDTGIIAPNCNWDLIVWVLITAALVIGILAAIKKTDLSNNSIHPLPFHLPLSFILTRTLFLIVYEFFFRGAILYTMIEDMNVVLAIIINLFLYALVHWFDKQERRGSLIMGIILCSITIHYHSVWPAIIIHLSLALSHEITLLIKYKSLIKKSFV